jgi:hypothetical protein
VLHINRTSLKYQLGVGASSFSNSGGGALQVMPMFNFQASDDPDVTNSYPVNTNPAYATMTTNPNSPTYSVPVAQAGGWVPIQPSGGMMSLVAVGSYELVSTSFYLRTGQTFHVNDHLTATTYPDANAGLLQIGTLGTDTICGVVSRSTNADGTTDNGYGTEAVAFWPVYLPAYPAVNAASVVG